MVESNVTLKLQRDILELWEDMLIMVLIILKI